MVGGHCPPRHRGGCAVSLSRRGGVVRWVAGMKRAGPPEGGGRPGIVDGDYLVAGAPSRVPLSL